jgi:hypothetical protein
LPEQRQTFAFRGGLDEETAALVIPPGRARGVLNHEAVATGYQRTEGYERFDGHPAPSDASFSTLTFNLGSADFAAGNIITGLTSGATARALGAATVASGTFGTADAVGSLFVHLVVGVFIPGESLQVGGVTRAHLNTAPLIGDWRDGAAQLAALIAAQTYARALITHGPVRGVLWYGGQAQRLARQCRRDRWNPPSFEPCRMGRNRPREDDQVHHWRPV